MLFPRRLHNYLVLSLFVTTVIISTSSLVRASVPRLQFNVKIAQNQTMNSDSDEIKIRKVILLSEQKYHWQPQVDILAVVDNYAITSVHDKNTGGESVLKKVQNDWQVLCGTGGAFGKVEELSHNCKVPLSTANRLLQIKAAHRHQAQ